MTRATGRTVHVADVLLTLAGEPVRDGGVVVDGDAIVAVGRSADLVREHPGARVRRWPGVMTPGLVNAHAHLEYGPPFADLARGGLPFASWIAELTRRRHTMDDAAFLAAARGSVTELLRAGTTCVADVVTAGPGVVAAARAGLAGVSYVESVGVGDDRAEAEVARVAALLDGAPAGRSVGVSPHSVYALSSGVVRALAALARDRGARLHIHLAETADEVEYVDGGEGGIADAWRRMGFAHELLGTGAAQRPTERLDGAAGLGDDVHVAHGVHLDAAERALLRERGTSVALCARSNAMLGAGEPPVAALLAEASPICVGTDSFASASSLDLLDELAALHAVATRQGASPDGLAEALVAAATTGGAAALGLAGRAGVLSPGTRADLAVFDVPVDGSPYDALVAHGAGRCVATVLAGRIVHRRAVAGARP